MHRPGPAQAQPSEQPTRSVQPHTRHAATPIAARSGGSRPRRSSLPDGQQCSRSSSLSRTDASIWAVSKACSRGRAASAPRLPAAKVSAASPISRWMWEGSASHVAATSKQGGFRTLLPVLLIGDKNTSGPELPIGLIGRDSPVDTTADRSPIIPPISTPSARAGASARSPSGRTRDSCRQRERVSCRLVTRACLVQGRKMLRCQGGRHATASCHSIVPTSTHELAWTKAKVDWH